jgi:S1-C subfamily serine protease
MTCQSTGGGLIGMAVAANASASCADTYRSRGYKPVAEAVATGIVLSKDEMPAKILTVKQDSPAAKAALKSGDIILAIDGQSVTNRIDAGKALHDGAVGSNTKVTVRRGDQELTVTLTRIAFATLADKS